MATQTTTLQQNILAPKLDPKATAPTERVRLYKEFLTPALHRRFINAVGILFAVCYVSGIIITNFSGTLITVWFPIGPAGARASLLLITSLSVLVVRVANMHIGERHTTSGAELAYDLVWRRLGQTLHTVGWYAFAGWLFGEFYVWTRGDSAELGLVLPYESYERPRLNENPIFLRSLFIVLGVLQAGLHLVNDYDYVNIPATPREAREREQEAQRNVLTSILSPETVAKLPTVVRTLADKLGPIVHSAVNITIVTVMAHIFIYFLVLRRPLWSFFYSIARTWFQLPNSAPPPGISDLHIWALFRQTLTAPLALSIMWEVTNTIFTVFVAQAPILKDAPLTSEVKDTRGVLLRRSKDPNHSLLDGLKNKREVNKTFAFWELYLIATQYDNRRKTIYTEVARKDGSTWSQVCEVALKEVAAIGTRIQAEMIPEQKTVQEDKPAFSRLVEDDLNASKPEQRGLPKIADREVTGNGDVFTKKQPDFAQTFGNLARSVGQSANTQNPITPTALKYLEFGADQLVSKEGRERLSRNQIQQQADSYLARILQTPIGEAFRSTFARQVKKVVFGSPTSNKANIVFATRALTELAVKSLKEDDYGQVQADIAKIVRAFTATIKSIENYTQQLKPHWTDFGFTQQDRHVAEVQELLEILKTCLKQIMLTFGEYASVLGLSKKEVREAGEATGDAPAPVALIGGRPTRPNDGSIERPEMQQVGNEGGIEAGGRQRRAGR
ncbi:hypothetical protein DOTSEDRAFT_57605 [Dothistroma septosporum NZE10]|uniref:Nuclear envelope protein n=1 Tax=Dothistroma septosporum (strain NZE10 / CBS 128990) TaxID=675120 RepID=N1PEI4_DOTSN|nr:hypothetical protein DOTSEDRAFT_57605 [Dothistroma septosporum NZE10]